MSNAAPTTSKADALKSSLETFPNRARSRVQKVTVDFRLIRPMAVTMGETAGDYLAVNLGFELTTSSRGRVRDDPHLADRRLFLSRA